MITTESRQNRLKEAEKTIESIHDGEVDAVVSGPVGDAVYTAEEMKESLRRNERNLADFFENAAIGLHWVGPDGSILRANQAELDLLGYPREEYVGHHIAEFHADAEVIADILRRLQAGETLHDYEARLRCKDGSIKHVLIDSNVLWEDGRFIHTRCFTCDITERKRAEEARSRLAAIVESSEDAIVTTSLDGVITSWNKGAERVFGYSAKDVVGCPITILAAADLPNDSESILERFRRGERIKHYETLRRTKDGRDISISLAVSPIRDATGRIIGISGIARDITEQKRLEEALKDQARQLAEADHRKDEFLAMLGHELRNPLAPISNAVQIMKMEGPGGPNHQWSVSVIEGQVKNIIRMVDDLLDASRITRGKVTLVKTSVELAAVVAHAIETIRPIIDQHRHELTISLPPDPVFLDADPIRIAQVLSNLLNNAAKYTEEGGQVQITAERVGQEVAVRVRDNGVGISPEMLTKVFDMFTQVDESRGRSNGGLGIGLSLARHLTEMHGGSVIARSEGRGRGSEFEVRLPVRADARPATAESVHLIKPIDLETLRSLQVPLGFLRK